VLLFSVILLNLLMHATNMSLGSPVRKEILQHLKYSSCTYVNSKTSKNDCSNIYGMCAKNILHSFSFSYTVNRWLFLLLLYKLLKFMKFV
jgi:hypothetical protein